MKRARESMQQVELLEKLVNYVHSTNSLEVTLEESRVCILQRADKKVIHFEIAQISDVLTRTDGEGKSFIQVNFVTGKKILLTDHLIGFKPVTMPGLDISKLPKVVTTPDLVSVYEAIEEAYSAETEAGELDALKKVYNSILLGGESVGFDLADERQWLWLLSSTKATA